MLTATDSAGGEKSITLSLKMAVTNIMFTTEYAKPTLKLLIKS